MSDWLHEWWDYEAPERVTGYVSTLPVDGGRDYGAELRAVVEEVTGRSVEAPEPRRIGFVWPGEAA